MIGKYQIINTHIYKHVHIYIYIYEKKTIRRIFSRYHEGWEVLPHTVGKQEDSSWQNSSIEVQISESMKSCNMVLSQTMKAIESRNFLVLSQRSVFEFRCPREVENGTPLSKRAKQWEKREWRIFGICLLLILVFSFTGWINFYVVDKNTLRICLCILLCTNELMDRAHPK